MSRPSLPPRRSGLPPPPPPRRASSSTSTTSAISVDSDVEEKPMGIAARIASLQLNQVGRNPQAKPPPPPIPRIRSQPAPVEVPSNEEDEQAPPSRSRPPPPPARKISLPPPLPRRESRPTPDELAARGDAYLRALKRKPPPPPTRSHSNYETSSSPQPAIPARRLPPMPTRLPTPPPEPEPEPEPEPYYEEAYGEGYQGEGEQASCLKCHDFSHIDEHAALFPRHTVSTLDQLAYDLTEPWGSETEKCRAIFTWLHHNIAYDTVSFFSGNLQPSTGESTLRSGLAVCDGYAGLFLSLAEKAGLQAQKVTGHGKGFGYTAVGPDAPVPAYQGNHAWNCVLMDGEWRLIDTCWGAGALEGSNYTPRLASMWFTSTPAEFGKSHFPEDPAYQLISDEDGGPVSWEEYILVGPGPTIFQDCYKQYFAPDLIIPADKYVQSGSWVSFHLFKLCEHMSREEADNYVYFVNLPDNTKTPLVANAEGGWSANVYIPRGEGEVSIFYVTTFDGRDGKGLGIQTFTKGIGKKAMAYQGIARWDAV